MRRACLLLPACYALLFAAENPLQDELVLLTKNFDGRAGVCAVSEALTSCVNPDQRFSLQSVVKLIVGMAVLDRVDQGSLHLDDAVLVRRSDLSVYVQPIAKLVGPEGYRTTLGDLVRRAIVDSDSAAADILFAKLGGPAAVQSYLIRKDLAGFHIYRDERHLQTEIAGLTWKSEYVDPDVLDRAIAALPGDRRDAAYKRYQTDFRDTATPRAMATLLLQLANGKLLSPESTRWLLDVMRQTTTFPDRLKAGTPPSWTIAHKTGTSGGWQSVTAATNDVGILTPRDGGPPIAIAVFLADSRALSTERAALMAKLAAATIAHASAR